MVEAYIAIGFFVLIIMVSTSPRSVSSTALPENLIIGAFVVLLWPVALFMALRGRDDGPV